MAIASQARSEDAQMLRRVRHQLVEHAMGKKLNEDSIHLTVPKSELGFNHLDVAELLIPATYLDEFRRDKLG
jgi:hypothetical protein